MKTQHFLISRKSCSKCLDFCVRVVFNCLISENSLNLILFLFFSSIMKCNKNANDRYRISLPLILTFDKLIPFALMFFKCACHISVQSEQRHPDNVHKEALKDMVHAALTCENNITSAVDVCLRALELVHILV